MVDGGEQPDRDVGVWIHRRDFLVRSGLLLGVGTLAGCLPPEPSPAVRSLGSTAAARAAVTDTLAATPAARPLADSPPQQPATTAANLTPAGLDSWDAVREQFNLARDLIHMAGFFLASHPRPVRDAIDAHRRGLDDNPIE